MVVTTFTFGPVETHGYVVTDEESGACAVIDPGMECEGMLDFVRKQGWRVEWILNTHGHWDHVYCNSLVVRETGAPLAIHPGDAQFLEGLEDQCFWMGIEPAEPSPRPDQLLNEGDEIAVGGLRASVLHTPGHSPGGVCFWFKSEGVLFSGDALFAGTIGRTDLPGGDHQQLLHSVRTKLLSLPDETQVYAGHDPVTTIGQERGSNPFVHE